MAKSSAKTLQDTAAVDNAMAAAFEQFLTEFSPTKAGDGAVLRLSDPGQFTGDAIPTGAISLDAALGVGGIPRGRITEFFGQPMSGKTSLALSVAANDIRLFGGRLGVVDAEQAMGKKHAIDMGVDISKAAIYQPNSGEDGLSMCEKMIISGAFSVVIVDSVAALVPQKEIDADYGESGGMGLHARMMSQAMRKLTPLVKKNNVALIFINQVRKDLGAYGTPDTTTGGKALPFYASVRVKVAGGQTKSSRLLKGTEAYGQLVTAEVVKNKVAPPFKKAEYELHYGKGIQSEASLVDVCKTIGLIQQKSSSYTIVMTGDKFVGQEKLKAALAADAQLQQALTEAVYAHLRDNGTDIDLESMEQDEGYDSLEEETAAA